LNKILEWLEIRWKPTQPLLLGTLRVTSVGAVAIDVDLIFIFIFHSKENILRGTACASLRDGRPKIPETNRVRSNLIVITASSRALLTTHFVSLSLVSHKGRSACGNAEERRAGEAERRRPRITVVGSRH
jgi:hypothetical protein